MSLRELFRRLFHRKQAPLPPPVVAPRPVYFGYFGSNDAQVAQTADHVNILFAAWGTDQQLAARMGEAKMPVILDVSDCLFTAGNPRHYVGDDAAEAAMRTRLNWCAHVDGAPIVSLYLIDEPEREANVSADEIGMAAATARKVAAEYGLMPALHICYGDGEDYRGLEFIDWAGVDKYSGDAIAILQRLKTRLSATQRLVAYPGGADPWRNDPAPFCAFALAEPSVIAIVAFIWISPWGGTDNKGICDNGMADAYKQAALSLRSPG